MITYLVISKQLKTYKTDKTNKAYFSAFQRWKRFIEEHGHCALPAIPVHIALYITHLIEQGSTVHPVNSAIYAIKWAHQLTGFDDPTQNSFILSLQEAAKRTAYRKVHKKEPVTTDMLIELCQKYVTLTIC